MWPFDIVCKLVFTSTKLGAETGCQKNFSVSFELILLRRLNFTPRIITVLRACGLIWSSASFSNRYFFLEYCSRFEIVTLLFSSSCFNLFVLFSASDLVSLILMCISYNLLFSWSNVLFIVSLTLVATLTALAEISCDTYLSQIKRDL